ncbi:MAG: class I SAM-dependent methyltransferase [Flavobacteriaceae bacterium]|nr:class I SAM-dependent methyltransferase [Flavobacteriaceae bacterium]
MNKSILNTVVQNFIDDNLNEDLVKLTMKGSPFSNVSIQEIVIQIQGRLKAKSKLPTWFKTKDIYYPPKLHIEQTSSEATAQYKSELVRGDTLADLTGGFGVDTLYFSKQFKETSHFEINNELSKIVSHNFSILSPKIRCYIDDGINAIKNKKFDVIFVDPSRRNETKGKVFYLSDCLPNVVIHLDYLLKHCTTLMIKTSPMLDISAGLKELRHVYQIHIVAVKNEVKELIWLIEKGRESNVNLVTVNILESDNEVFEAPLNLNSDINYSLPKKFLFEPNAAIMKSGLFETLCLKFPVEKIAPSSHLFTSDNLIDFPGRRFEITKVIPYAKAEVKKALLGIKANISTRNFPETVSRLKTKWKIKDGGDLYLFFTTDSNNNKFVLFCRKV